MAYIKIKDAIKTDTATDTDAADTLCARIVADLKFGNRIVLNFKDLKVISPAFLKHAIGNLLYHHPQNVLDERIAFDGMPPDIRKVLRRVINEVREHLRVNGGYLY